jgi:hypothetical protein
MYSEVFFKEVKFRHPYMFGLLQNLQACILLQARIFLN